MYHFWWRRALLERVLSNSSDEERKQEPFSCETLIATWKELSVLASVMHSASAGLGFKHRAFCLSLSRFEPLAAMPWGCACTIPLQEQCKKPWDQGEGRKGSTYPLLCNQVTAPSTASALLSLIRAVERPVHAAGHRKGVPRSAPAQGGKAGMASTWWPVWAELPWCRAPEQVEGSDAAGTVGFSALLEQELEPRVKMSGLGLSDSFPYRQLVHSLLHCCPF